MFIEEVNKDVKNDVLGKKDISQMSQEELEKLHVLLALEKKRRESMKSKNDCLEQEAESILKAFLPIVKGLGKTLGKNYEIVLHDVSSTESSIIAIENGHVTGRSIGSPATDYLMHILTSMEKEEVKLNYISHTKDGRKLKSSTVLIRDSKDNIIGSLCINIDLTNIEVAQKFLADIGFVEEKESYENFPEDVSQFLNIMIEKGLELVDKPVALLSKEEKLKVVEYLLKNKVFNIKGAVDLLADTLSVSRYTIYNYIEEVSANLKEI